MSVIVVFYSRYNQKSIDFVNDLGEIMEIRKLCVDSSDVRQAIVGEKEHYNIRKVPTVLIFHSNGFLEKHEGHSDCVEWYRTITKKEFEIPVETVKPIDQTEKIPVESLTFEPRKMDTQPLFERNDESKAEVEINDKLKADQEQQVENSIRKNNSVENVMSLAQQMQKQREMEVKD